MNNKNSGFTLIETIIYLALFTIIIGGGMVATYQIIQSTNVTHSKVIIQEDADFLLRKLAWALTGAKQSDVSSVTSTSLTVRSMTFSLNGTDLTLNGNPLNSSFVKIGQVSGLPIFDHPTPEKIQITFTINDQRFDETQYLH